MKKIIVLCLFTVLFHSLLFSPILAQQNDEDVYKSVLCQLGNDKSTLPVYYKTSLTLFKRRIDFSKTDLNKWDGKDTVINWKPFFESIDLDKIKETEIASKIDAHPFTTKMYEEDKNHRANSFLTLSPVIYSSDKSLALCSVSFWGNRDNMSETIYLLEFKKGKWQVVKYLWVAFS